MKDHRLKICTKEEIKDWIKGFAHNPVNNGFEHPTHQYLSEYDVLPSATHIGHYSHSDVNKC